MEDSKKATKKAAPKKDVKFNEEEATSYKQSKKAVDEAIVFGAGASDMVNFGGEDEEQKEREHNVVHLHYQQRTGRKCLTII